MSTIVMYLTRQANAFTLTGWQAVTVQYHSAETLVADPVASTTCSRMQCRLQTCSNTVTPESKTLGDGRYQGPLDLVIALEGRVVLLIDRPHG